MSEGSPEVSRRSGLGRVGRFVGVACLAAAVVAAPPLIEAGTCNDGDPTDVVCRFVRPTASLERAIAQGFFAIAEQG